MIKINLMIPVLIALVSVAFSSCEKEAGEGGTSRISGKVYQIQFDASFFKKANTDFLPIQMILPEHLMEI